MTQLTLFDKHYQPRFQAYLDHMGATHKSEVKMYEFIIWINRLVDEFKSMHDIQTLSGSHDEFTDYVWGRVHDTTHNI